MDPMTLPKLLVAKPVFPEVLERLRAHFQVIDNQTNVPWTFESWCEALSDCEAALTTSADLINEKVLAHCNRLKMCANMIVGFNNFDLKAMTARGILATNTPDVLTETTADFGLALILATARRMSEGERFLRAGLWADWRFDLLSGMDVHRSTLGIVGMGRIGQAIAKRAFHGFDMSILYHNRNRLSADIEAELAATWCTLTELLERSDHVILVLPYSPEFHHFIGAKELQHMKKGAHLINLARGGLIDENALVDALKSGHLGGAGLDVYEGEPRVNPKLLELDRVVLTPHIASSSLATRLAMCQLAADNLIGFFEHAQVKTPLNPEVLKR
jgi:gluconate 2-dehydrogenase